MIDALHAPAWTSALIAAAFSLVLVPTAMWIAGWAGFVAIPRVGNGRVIPYLGGSAVALAVLIGSQLERGLSWPVAVALLLATALGVVGLVDDHRPLSPIVRFLIEGLAASIVVAMTGPFALTGTAGVDVALTVVWVVTIVNGINFLDNSDALATVIIGLAAVGLVVAAGPRTDVGVCAAAIAGASAVFFAFNVRPAAVYLGDAGSMFLGFLLPVLALELVHRTAQPGHATWTVLILLALPLLEILITSARRILHGRRFWLSAPDNLSYALARRGLGTSGALAVHFVAQFLLLITAVLVFDAKLAASVGIAVVAVELFAFTTGTRGVDVHGPRIPSRRSTRKIVFVVLVGTSFFIGVAALVVVRAYRAATAGSATLDVAERHLRTGDTAQARTEFERAEQELAHANNLLTPVALFARVVPGVAQNVDAAKTAIDSARDLAREGAHFASSVDAHEITLRHGDVPVAAVENMQGPLDELASAVTQAHQRIAAVDDSMLLAPVAHKVAQMRSLLESAEIDTANAASFARVAPAVLGANGNRHYLVVVQNPAEARATGGIPASFDVLEAQDGRLRLGHPIPVEQLDAGAHLLHAAAPPAPTEYLQRYGRFEPQLWWENTAMSPDFPTVASVMAAQYERQMHQHIDGVVSLDPTALGAILRVAGPVHVAGWPTPITSNNVASVVLRDEYARFHATKNRKAFLGRIMQAAWTALRRGDLGDPIQLARTLGPAADQRHLMIWLALAGEQHAIHNLGVDGAVPEPAGDALFATVQNAAATKLDLYMTRELSYRLTVEPVAGDRANISGTASLSVENNAPSALPAFVATPEAGHYQVGELHSFVSLYSSLDLVNASIDGGPEALETNREFGRWAYSTFVSVERGHRTQLDLSLRGSEPLTSNTYSLQLLPQPSAQDEVVNVAIRVPQPFAILDAEGCVPVGDHACERVGRLDQPEVIRVQLRST
jgi:UDP-N-acetylmuramyl pentapeptide phosphotransferase/UDP-N-acetylglucosamine-1-phosphate transferase